MSLKNLEVAFKFTEDDLAANRTGRMSREQVRRLRRRLYLISGVAMIPLIAVLALVVGVPTEPGLPMQLGAGVLTVIGVFTYNRLRVTLTWEDIRRQYPYWIMALIGVLAGFSGNAALTMNILAGLGYVASALIIPMMLWRAVRLHMTTVTGKITLDPGSQSRVHIGELVFNISGRQLLALRDGGTYTVHYEPLIHHLLSVEPLEHDEESAPMMLDKAKHEDAELVLGDDGELVLQHKSTRS